MINSNLAGRITILARVIAMAVVLLAIGCALTPSPTAELPPPVAPVDTNFVHATATLFDSGMVVCAHPLAAAAGKRSLLRAAMLWMPRFVFSLAMLNVVEPHASGLGGGGFAFYYDKAADSVYTLDYRERAPKRLNRSIYFQPEDNVTYAAHGRNGRTRSRRRRRLAATPSPLRHAHDARPVC